MAPSDPVTSPTPVAAPAPVPYGANGTDATKLCAGVVNGVSCLVQSYARTPALSATVRVTNAGPTPQYFNLTSYKKYANGFELQVKYDRGSDRILLLPGTSSVVSVTSFECAAQIDAYLGDEINHPPHPAGVLLGYESTSTTLCVDPKPPVTPPVVPPVEPPPPVDVCPNLDGRQTAVPEGFALIDGLCVPQQPPTVQCPDFTALMASHNTAAIAQYVSPFNVHAMSETEACVDVVVHDLPVGCTVPLSLGSYQRYNQSIKFPQAFIGASYGEFSNGSVGCAIPVKKQAGCYQVDLRFGRTAPEDLTQVNESADYGWRTLDWITNPHGAICPPIAVE